MVTYRTSGRPPVAYFGLLLGNVSAAFLGWSLRGHIDGIIAIVFSLIFVAVTLGYMGVGFFRNINPRFADEALFLNAAFFAGTAAMAGYDLWSNRSPEFALGAVFAYSALVLNAVSIWLGLRSSQRSGGHA